jgi:cold shock CspA family protein
MSRSGTSVGTVVRWDEQAHGAVIEVPDLSGDVWADAAAVDTAEGTLRAGQVVSVEWTEEPAHGLPFRAVRVRRRQDLQATPGA